MHIIVLTLEGLHFVKTINVKEAIMKFYLKYGEIKDVDGQKQYIVNKNMGSKEDRKFAEELYFQINGVSSNDKKAEFNFIKDK